MKRIAILAIAAAIAVPASAIAEDSPTPAPNAAKACKAERAGMGAQAFKDLYGTNKNKSNAFGKCVSKQRREEAKATKEAKQNAPAKCRAERDADPAAFATKYGTGENGKNAFGRCVSQTAKHDAAEAVAEQDDDTVDAAKACKAERKADPDAFAQTYGTNENKKNAFGKCVSKKVREKQQNNNDDDNGEDES